MKIFEVKASGVAATAVILFYPITTMSCLFALMLIFENYLHIRNPNCG